MTKATIKVDKEKCLGCGSCFATAPEIFAIDNDGKAKVILVETEDPVIIEKAKMAKDMCPNAAIEVIEL
jgi:ferredoxin